MTMVEKICEICKMPFKEPLTRDWVKTCSEDCGYKLLSAVRISAYKTKRRAADLKQIEDRKRQTAAHRMTMFDVEGGNQGEFV